MWHVLRYLDSSKRGVPRIDEIVRGDGEEAVREIVQKGISPAAFYLENFIRKIKNRFG